MDRVTPFGMILVLLWCLLPATATILPFAAIVLVILPGKRTLLTSLIFATGCLLIYAGLSIQFSSDTYRHYTEVIDSLPAGRFFRSFIPLAVAVIVICFDIYFLVQSKKKR